MTRFAVAAFVLLSGFLAVSLTKPAVADDVTIGMLKISAPWARATPNGAKVGGGYMTITNTGTAPDRLVGGTTDISSRFEVHEMSMDNGVMKMRELGQGLEIKPGEKVEFKPGGYHVMFMDLKQQLVQGQTFKATLRFEKAGPVDVNFVIEGIGAKSAGMHDSSAMPMKH